MPPIAPGDSAACVVKAALGIGKILGFSRRIFDIRHAGAGPFSAIPAYQPQCQQPLPVP